MAGSDVVDVGDGDFKQQVLDSSVPVLVDFWATWCAPCKAISPVVDELAAQYRGKVKVAKVNIDQHQGTAQQFGIRSIPTLLVFKGGRVVEQLVGAGDARKRIDAALQKALSA